MAAMAALMVELCVDVAVSVLEIETHGVCWLAPSVQVEVEPILVAGSVDGKRLAGAEQGRCSRNSSQVERRWAGIVAAAPFKRVRNQRRGFVVGQTETA